jgi:hypothetical protein
MVDEMMNQYAGDLERRVNERTVALVEAQRRADHLLNQVVAVQFSKQNLLMRTSSVR